MKRIVVGLVCWGLLVPGVSAGVLGGVEPKTFLATDDYEAVAFSVEDWRLLAGALPLALGLSLEGPVSVKGLGVVGLLAYGAWRTKRYRSDAAQAAMHAQPTQPTGLRFSMAPGA